MWYFTADEHYGHEAILKYCDRPFGSIQEMDEEIIERHNKIVKSGDITVHIGDFSFHKREVTCKIVRRLNGSHIFTRGDHDRWADQKVKHMWTGNVGEHYVVACHWPMRTWPRSFHGSIMLHGHEHGRLDDWPRSMDVGVDANNFYPFSFAEIKVKIFGKIT